jgi:hypothetical protein
MKEQFLSRVDFAKRLSVSQSTVDRGIKYNIYPYSKYIRIGCRVLYPELLLAELCTKAMQGNEYARGIPQ